MAYYKFPDYNKLDTNYNLYRKTPIPNGIFYRNGNSYVMSEKKHNQAINCHVFSNNSSSVPVPDLDTRRPVLRLGNTISVSPLAVNSYVWIVDPTATTATGGIDIAKHYSGASYISTGLFVTNPEFIKILKYDNDDDISLFAALETQSPSETNPYSINFYRTKPQIPNTTDGYLDLVGQYKHIDPSDSQQVFIPGKFTVDISNQILFATFYNILVAIDYSDPANPQMLSSFVFDSIDRTNAINDIIIDLNSNIIICSTQNKNGLYDMLHFLYYDHSTNSFTLRNTYTINNVTNFNSIFLHNNYIYTINNNAIDISGQENLRKDLCLYVLEPSNSYQSIAIKKQITFGEYWNDNKISISDTDRGYLAKLPYRHDKIMHIKNNIMYVLCNSPLSIEGGKYKQYNEVLNILMYNINNINDIKIIGSHSVRDTLSKAFYADTYNMIIADENLENGTKRIIENISNSPSGGVSSIYSKIFLIEPKNIGLMQEIVTTGDLFDIDHSEVSASILAIAEGYLGIKIMYLDKSRNPIVYKLLDQLRPINPDDNTFATITRVEIQPNISNNTNVFSLMAIGEKFIFFYGYDDTSGNGIVKIQEPLSLHTMLGLDVSSQLSSRLSSSGIGRGANSTSIYVERTI